MVGILFEKVSTWTPAGLDNGHAVSQADPAAWTRGAVGAAVKVFGYFVTNGRLGAYLWAEQVQPGQEVDMSVDGQVVIVWPQLTLRSEYDPKPIFCGGVNVFGE